MLSLHTFHRRIAMEIKELRHQYYQDESPQKRYGEVKSKWSRYKREIINNYYYKRIIVIGRFIYNIINRGQNIVPPPSLEQLCKLFRVERYHICSYQSCVQDVTQRYNYICELIERYQAFESINLPHALLCFSSSATHLITMTELGLLQIISEHYNGKITFCVKVDYSLSEELKIDAIFYER